MSASGDGNVSDPAALSTEYVQRIRTAEDAWDRWSRVWPPPFPLKTILDELEAAARAKVPPAMAIDALMLLDSLSEKIKTRGEAHQLLVFAKAIAEVEHTFMERSRENWGGPRRRLEECLDRIRKVARLRA